MQPVNDDMDHLFRQAANDYPLNTQGADFNKLQQRMQAPEAEATPQKGSRRRYSWLLLLLLALPFVCRHYYTPQTEGNSSSSTQQPDNKKAQLSKSDLIIQNNTPTPNKTTVANNTDSQITTTPVPTNTTTKLVNVSKPTSPKNSLTTQQPNSTLGNSFLKKKNNQKASEPSATTVDIAYRIFGSKTRKDKGVNTKQKNNKTDLETGDVASKSNANSSSKKEDTLLPGSAISSTGEINQLDSILLTDSTPFTSRNIDTTSVTISKTTTAKDTTALDSASLVKKHSESTKKPKPTLYVGVVAGPDYSAVKSLQTAGMGYNAGIVVGYRFGRHWAAETGLLWNFKKYYADGQYVSTEKLGLQPHTQVLNIDGACGMFEIPLNVQYHFSSKHKGHWYTSAGLSSYLMKKEEYYYWYKRYNMQYYGEKEYHNSSKNWLSVLQLSGGYQWQWGKRGSLRAEPYVKLPIAKIGIAGLTLSSAGINIGYTMPL